MHPYGYESKQIYIHTRVWGRVRLERHESAQPSTYDITLNKSNSDDRYITGHHNKQSRTQYA